MTELCEFSKGLCIHCGDAEQGECEGWNPPPKREWVGLSAADMREITLVCIDKVGVMLMTEDKLKELNHGV